MGRHKELQQIQQSLKINKSKAILVYGRRRIGKTSLINEALKFYTGIKIVQFESIKLPIKTISGPDLYAVNP